MRDFESIYKDTDAINVQAEVDFTDVTSLIFKRQNSDAVFAKEDLAAIANNFYNLMRYRCRRSEDILTWLEQNKSTIEPITIDLLHEPKVKSFRVDGMYGGFVYGLFERDGKPVLITDSWSRISGGSGEQHEITPDQVKLIAVGFV